MAKGDVTLTQVKYRVEPGSGGLKRQYFTAAPDNYKTNGWDFSALASSYGFSTVYEVSVTGDCAGVVFAYDYTNNYLKAYVQDGAAGLLVELGDDDSTLASSTLRVRVDGVGV